MRRRAEHNDHVWSYDVVVDLNEDGRKLKMMPVVDEYTRERLSIEVERSITVEVVVGTLASLFRSRSEPAFIRSDNGPEFLARAIRQWLEVSGVRTLYIEPGTPWENAYSETFIRGFSEELRYEFWLGIIEMSQPTRRLATSGSQYIQFRDNVQQRLWPPHMMLWIRLVREIGGFTG